MQHRACLSDDFRAFFFQALSQSYKHYLCANYFPLLSHVFFPPPGLPSRCLDQQPCSSKYEPLCQQEECSWEHAGCGSTHGQRLSAKGCAGARTKRLLLHPHHLPNQHLPLSAGHSGCSAYLHRWENKQCLIPFGALEVSVLSLNLHLPFVFHPLHPVPQQDWSLPYATFCSAIHPHPHQCQVHWLLTNKPLPAGLYL